MDINSYFANRRSVRQFTEMSVDESSIKEMIGLAMHAPTTGNMQLYSVVATRNADNKKKLCEYHFNQPASVNADVLLTFCLDFDRFERWCRLSNAVPGFSNFQSFMMGVLDAAIFAQQFVCVAEMNGYGTCYLGTTIYNAPQIASLLSLPRRVVPIITVALGFPGAMPEDCGRLPVDAILHSESYMMDSDYDIIGFYRDKEHRTDSCIFVEENRKQSLAQVFTDVRYPQATLEQFSRSLLEYLKPDFSF